MISASPRPGRSDLSRGSCIPAQMKSPLPATIGFAGDRLGSLTFAAKCDETRARLALDINIWKSISAVHRRSVLQRGFLFL